MDVLLKNKANVHARTPRGIGALALADAQARKVRSRNPGWYDRIMACMGLASDYGAVMLSGCGWVEVGVMRFLGLARGNETVLLDQW